MIKIEDCIIEAVTPENYYMYDDMVFWRLNERERTQADKAISEKKSYTKAIEALRHNGFYVYAAQYQSRFVGWIHLIYMPKIGRWQSGVLYVDELWVTPEFRRHGVAKMLCEKANELKVKLKADRIRLYTDNPIAQRVYEKSGLFMNYMSIKETSEKWQISDRRISFLCSKSRIKGDTEPSILGIPYK